MTINELKKNVERRHYGARVPVEIIDDFIRASYISGKLVQESLAEAMIMYTIKYLGSKKN